MCLFSNADAVGFRATVAYRGNPCFFAQPVFSTQFLYLVRHFDICNLDSQNLDAILSQTLFCVLEFCSYPLRKDRCNIFRFAVVSLVSTGAMIIGRGGKE